MKIKPVTSGRLRIGVTCPAFIIAEAGVNHNGRLPLAKKLVLEAMRAGADCVKFQTFKAERVVTLKAPKAAYQLRTTSVKESQFDMLKKLELSDRDHEQLIRFCRKNGIIFLSTPYSTEDADFLDRLGAPAFKIASGQIIELPFLRHVAKKGKPILLSTGMSTIAEIDAAVRTIKAAGNNKIVLLQCTTNYPSRIEDANLAAMATMRRRYSLNVGYSDHTESIAPSIAAVALGACVIEKHFTLDKKMPGPDHSSSAEPRELASLVRAVREVERAVGTGIKAPSKSEEKNIRGMRRSIVAKELLPKGTIIRPELLCFKRPATGLSPALADKLKGKRTRRDIPKDAFLSFKDIV